MCACKGGNTKAPNPVPRQPAPPIPRQAPRDNSRSFCPRCGWLLKRIRYIDVKTNAVVDHISCTNGQCTNR